MNEVIRTVSPWAALMFLAGMLYYWNKCRLLSWHKGICGCIRHVTEVTITVNEAEERRVLARNLELATSEKDLMAAQYLKVSNEYAWFRMMMRAKDPEGYDKVMHEHKEAVANIGKSQDEGVHNVS